MNTEKALQPHPYKCVVRFEKRLFVPAQLVAGAGLCVGLYFTAAWYWLVMFCLPLEVASIAVLWWPMIEPTNRVVRERALLFGKKMLAERITPLNEFTEIFYEHTPNSDGDSNYRLGLRHNTGRKLWVGGNWEIRRAVEATAWELSCTTGIKLKERPF